MEKLYKCGAIMIFKELPMTGAYLLQPEVIDDERGFFYRVQCSQEFQEKGLHRTFLQSNISHNIHKGTLRGMHYQKKPYAETKLVRCTRGSIYDVILDLRKNSKTYKNWISIELNSKEHCSIYIPEGCAHGFQTLENDTDVFYQMSCPFVLEAYLRCCKRAPKVTS